MSKPSNHFNPSEYYDFQSVLGTHRLHDAFCQYLTDQAPQLLDEMESYQQGQHALSQAELSRWLIDLAVQIEGFLCQYFKVGAECDAVRARIETQHPLVDFKYKLVKKALKGKVSPDALFATCHQAILAACKGHAFDLDDMELAWACLYQQATQSNDTETLSLLTTWCQLATQDPHGRAIIQCWPSFQQPDRLAYEQLIFVETTDDGHLYTPEASWGHRDGFDLTDQRMSGRDSALEAYYCVDCHEQAGDFCRSGFPVKKKDPSLGYKINPLDEVLTGCPVDEKISEMHWLYKRGHLIAALAMAMRDNPLCALTGHRICNECMKACIYQKQTPVNIPQIETSILSQVLHLPWGVEIYDLLMRWNPLRPKQWLIQAHNDRRICVMGMGPAGISLAHHLLMDGYAVVGMDGLKIEPLDDRYIKEPIAQFSEINQALSDRLPYGFGGVAEYGITNRWDKNFLTLVYIILSRREHFRVYGGVRFGGSMMIEDAWALGFDHLAIAVGAGLPKALPVDHSMAPGMRQANDFLMALLLSDATQPDSLSDIQVELPAVVIGGGLTAVDAATECQAYYIKQVERLLHRYEGLKTTDDDPLKTFDQSSQQKLERMLAHARLIREERHLASQEQRDPHLIQLIQQWGGVHIVYRKTMADSPAYQRNHEELQKALEEGIQYQEVLSPISVALDEDGHCSALICRTQMKDEHGHWLLNDHDIRVEARTILVATGAQTNIAYAFEHRGELLREGFEYQTFAHQHGQLTRVEHKPQHCKDEHYAPLTSYHKDGYRVSFLGDTHPMYHGNVVKAIASGKRLASTIPSIIDSAPMKKQSIGLDESFGSIVLSRELMLDGDAKLVIKSPWLAQKHQPGQFYRLQNFFRDPIVVHGKAFNMQGLRVTPTMVDDQAGTLTFMLANDLMDEQLAHYLEPGHRLQLMGPTGNRQRAIEDKTVCFVGGKKAWQMLLSLAPMLSDGQNQVVWLMTESCSLHDISWLRNVLKQVFVMGDLSADDQAALGVPIIQCAAQSINDAMATLLQTVPDIARFYVMGDSTLIRKMQHARKGHATHIDSHAEWIAHVDVPMQCMMKGVCAQCLVWQRDAQGDHRTKAVYACSWQDQPMELVDPVSIQERQRQGAAVNQLNKIWFQDLLNTHK